MWIVLAIFTLAFVLFGVIWLLSPTYDDYLSIENNHDFKDIEHSNLDEEGIIHDEY